MKLDRWRPDTIVSDDCDSIGFVWQSTMSLPCSRVWDLELYMSELKQL